MNLSLINRRNWIKQSTALIATAFAPWLPVARAQFTSTLSALPRIALVLGNARYADAPLNNPVNDAHAIAATLTATGFEVTLKLDAGRSQMLEAIDAFGAELKKKKCVGAFYYAGHGAQLAWKNYLIPVDAKIDNVEDLRTRTVELNALLEGLRKAQNPMNVIILDACRDNPFGNKINSQQKGLSQFDAPPGSLLAYATSPGNTAADGDGTNGLYTENLLRELKVPGARIEDVFKRVRLNVRRRSSGQQIPWESTSLEDDFYFLPPTQIRKFSEEELSKQFSEELALWEKIREANTPAPLIAYLEKYPSGKFSELAQYQLDRVLKSQGEKALQASEENGNPFSKGTAQIDAQFKIGDSYSYREFDLYSKVETKTLSYRVTATSETRVQFNDGALITDIFGNQLRTLDGWTLTDAQFFIPAYAIGKKWSTRFQVSGVGRLGSFTGQSEIDFKVTAREQLTVPAGSFDAFRIEGEGWTQLSLGGAVQIRHRYWIAPGLRRPIATENYRRHTSGRILGNEREELTAYRQS